MYLVSPFPNLSANFPLEHKFTRTSSECHVSRLQGEIGMLSLYLPDGSVEKAQDCTSVEGCCRAVGCVVNGVWDDHEFLPITPNH